MTTFVRLSPGMIGDKRALSKLAVEALANKVYDVQLAGELRQRLWAYANRKGSLAHCIGVVR